MAFTRTARIIGTDEYRIVTARDTGHLDHGTKGFVRYRGVTVSGFISVAMGQRIFIPTGMHRSLFLGRR